MSHIEKAAAATQFVLLHSNGTYFKDMTGIGPMFGATLDEAKRFPSRFDAAQQMGRHWAFCQCEVRQAAPEPRAGG